MPHPGLQKLFYNLSLASKKVEERHRSHEKLSGYLQKIKIVASRSPKKSVIHSEVVQLEKHISEMLSKKMHIPKGPDNASELMKLKQKEAQLDGKIAQMNVLLSQVGKKISEKKLKEQLGKRDELEELEEKLYSLESKYHELEETDVPASLLENVRDKISLLKEKIRELKNK